MKMTLEEKYNLLVAALREKALGRKPQGYDELITMEDCIVDDYAAGNIDDAFFLGKDHGAYDFVVWAQNLLKQVE